MFRFLHAADIHLDSRLRGLDRYEGAPVERIRSATRRAFENLVTLALRERVDFVLLAGDLYDGDWEDYNTGLYLTSQLSRLREIRIPVFIITGNHDAASRITRALRPPENVTLLPTAKPGSAVLEKLGVAIHGQGFATAKVDENLADRYPPAHKGCFNIGLLHTSADGREGHARYAPCSLDDLRGKGYDYWALGHVHERETLCTDPLVIYPGNIQGRHAREPGAKGCLIVTVEKNKPVAQFHGLDVVRWHRCAVDLTHSDTEEAVLDRVTDRLETIRLDNQGRLSAIRVRLCGATRAHESIAADPQRWVNEVRARAIDIDGDGLWIEKVELGTTSSTASAGTGPFEELLAVVSELSKQDHLLVGELSELRKKLPAELAGDTDPIGLDDPAWLRGLLEQVPPLLFRRLLGKDTST